MEPHPNISCKYFSPPSLIGKLTYISLSKECVEGGLLIVIREAAPASEQFMTNYQLKLRMFQLGMLHFIIIQVET